MSSKRTIEKQRLILGRLLALVVLLVLGCVLLLAGDPDWLPRRIGQTSGLSFSLPEGSADELIQEETPPGETAADRAEPDGSVDEPEDDSRLTTETAEPGPTVAALTIHLTGSVRRPGLVEVAEGATLADAVQAAGGFTDDAAVDYVNLASKVEANSLLRIPSLLEVGGSEPPSYLPGGAVPDGTDSAEGQAGQADADAAGKVNINTADQTLLETLPGIGPSLAAAIVSEREAGGDFTSIEDLMRVPGIKEGKLAQLRSFVTTG